jgi:hypothetical protein
VNDPAGLDDLNRMLRGGNWPRDRIVCAHTSGPHYFSITWPPVTGMA